MLHRDNDIHIFFLQINIINYQCYLAVVAQFHSIVQFRDSIHLHN